MRTIDKIKIVSIVTAMLLAILYMFEIYLSRLQYDTLFAKCEQDKEIEIYGNKYWCVKIRGSKDL